jgi:hypothetical protein
MTFGPPKRRINAALQRAIKTWAETHIGQGSNRVASVNLVQGCTPPSPRRPAVALADDRESATVGVGSSRCAASRARLGRTAAPADSDWLEPYGLAVGVGSSTAGGNVVTAARFEQVPSGGQQEQPVTTVCRPDIGCA